MSDDLGRRIAAARAYAGLSAESLADSINMTPTAINRLEAGIEELDGEEYWAVIKNVSAATACPVAFFTTDFASLARGEAPTERLESLEKKIDDALERMNCVADEADQQMARGKEQLDRFIEHQAPDRELLRAIATHLGLPLP